MAGIPKTPEAISTIAPLGPELNTQNGNDEKSVDNTLEKELEQVSDSSRVDSQAVYAEVMNLKKLTKSDSSPAIKNYSNYESNITNKISNTPIKN